MSERPSFFAELRRRNVIRAAVLYGGAAWALAQGIAQLGPSLGMPEWGTRWFLVAACIGFPFWLAFAWFYEWTPEGFKREHEVEDHESITHHTGRKLDFAIIGVLAVAVVLLLTDRFVLRRGVNQEGHIAISEQSIAVLPFVNMSTDKEQEYFADGISEELLNLLAQVPELRVIARTSSFSFKGKDAPIAEIARTLNVANVLEGSVRKSGDTLRITAQLVRASDSSHLWSQTYDRQMADVFKVQDEIAAAVVSELKIKLLGATPKTRSTNPEAYNFFLQAREIGAQYTREALEHSVSLYKRALELDPDYVEAWVGLARAYCFQVNEGLQPPSTGIPLVQGAIHKALARDPQYAQAHAGLGWIAIFYERNLYDAAQHLERALALEPNNAGIFGTAAVLARRLGRMEQAIELGRFVVAHDPINAEAHFDLGLAYRYAGRLDEALGQYSAVRALRPSFLGIRGNIGDVLLLKGDPEAALAEIRQETDDSWGLIGLSEVYHALGRETESDAALAELIDKYGHNPSWIASVFAYRDDANRAFEWLEKAFEYHDPSLGAMAFDPMMKKIHPDPRWLPFLRKAGMAPEQLAAIKFDVKVPK
jgi:TolB-like protein/cytochrome c-type biogenesis protein CcmH/NrfG